MSQLISQLILLQPFFQFTRLLRHQLLTITMASWGEQFSSGDQNVHHRAEFWRSGFRICQGCQQSSGMTSRSETAGCRRNGDGYGTEVFTCTKCNWSTSFQYDEASDTYYYETRGWSTHSPAAGAPTDDVKKAST